MLKQARKSLEKRRMKKLSSFIILAVFVFLICSLAVDVSGTLTVTPTIQQGGALSISIKGVNYGNYVYIYKQGETDPRVGLDLKCPNNLCTSSIDTSYSVPSSWEEGSYRVDVYFYDLSKWISAYFTIANPSGAATIPESQPPVSGSTICSDSDSGKNYDIPGYVTKYSSTKVITYSDMCGTDGVTLNEYFCTGDIVESASYTCPEKCENKLIEGGINAGACVATTAPATGTCKDSDNGYLYTLKGTTTDKNGVISTDSCKDAKILIENGCNTDGTKSSGEISCPNACLNGACTGPFDYGDLSGDGIINTGDINVYTDILLQRISSPVSGTDWFKAADLNGDGRTDMIDNNLLIDFILMRITKFPVETVTTSSSCKDWDGGKTYYTPGYITKSSTGKTALAIFPDLCTSETTILEYFCTGETVDSIAYDCPYKCAAQLISGGVRSAACIPQPIGCTDSDGGLNYTFKGNVTDRTGLFIFDRCQDSYSAIETSCSSSMDAVESVRECQYGCNDGKCLIFKGFGDINYDGRLNQNDLDIFSRVISGTESAPPENSDSFAMADSNGDGVISSADYNIVSARVDNLNMWEFPDDKLEENAPTNPVDSDSGINQNEKGICSDYEGTSYIDSCASDKTLTEWYIDEYGYCNTKDIICDGNCKDGVCLPALEVGQDKVPSEDGQRTILLGDINLDGIVDVKDFLVINSYLASYGYEGHGDDWNAYGGFGWYIGHTLLDSDSSRILGNSYGAQEIWLNTITPGTDRFIAGDVNQDGIIDTSDLNYMTLLFAKDLTSSSLPFSSAVAYRSPYRYCLSAYCPCSVDSDCKAAGAYSHSSELFRYIWDRDIKASCTTASSQPKYCLYSEGWKDTTDCYAKGQVACAKGDNCGGVSIINNDLLKIINQANQISYFPYSQTSSIEEGGSFISGCSAQCQDYPEGWPSNQLTCSGDTLVNMDVCGNKITTNCASSAMTCCGADSANGKAHCCSKDSDSYSLMPIPVGVVRGEYASLGGRGMEFPVDMYFGADPAFNSRNGLASYTDSNYYSEPEEYRNVAEGDDLLCQADVVFSDNSGEGKVPASVVADSTISLEDGGAPLKEVQCSLVAGGSTLLNSETLPSYYRCEFAQNWEEAGSPARGSKLRCRMSIYALDENGKTLASIFVDSKLHPVAVAESNFFFLTDSSTGTSANFKDENIFGLFENSFGLTDCGSLQECIARQPNKLDKRIYFKDNFNTDYSLVIPQSGAPNYYDSDNQRRQAYTFVAEKHSPNGRNDVIILISPQSVSYHSEYSAIQDSAFSSAVGYQTDPALIVMSSFADENDGKKFVDEMNEVIWNARKLDNLFVDKRVFVDEARFQQSYAQTRVNEEFKSEIAKFDSNIIALKGMIRPVDIAPYVKELETSIAKINFLAPLVSQGISYPSDSEVYKKLDSELQQEAILTRTINLAPSESITAGQLAAVREINNLIIGLMGEQNVRVATFLAGKVAEIRSSNPTYSDAQIKTELMKAQEYQSFTPYRTYSYEIYENTGNFRYTSIKQPYSGKALSDYLDALVNPNGASAGTFSAIEAEARLQEADERISELGAGQTIIDGVDITKNLQLVYLNRKRATIGLAYAISTDAKVEPKVRAALLADSIKQQREMAYSDLQSYTQCCANPLDIGIVKWTKSVSGTVTRDAKISNVEANIASKIEYALNIYATNGYSGLKEKDKELLREWGILSADGALAGGPTRSLFAGSNKLWQESVVDKYITWQLPVDIAVLIYSGGLVNPSSSLSVGEAILGRTGAKFFPGRLAQFRLGEFLSRSTKLGQYVTQGAVFTGVETGKQVFVNIAVEDGLMRLVANGATMKASNSNSWFLANAPDSVINALMEVPEEFVINFGLFGVLGRASPLLKNANRLEAFLAENALLTTYGTMAQIGVSVVKGQPVDTEKLIFDSAISNLVLLSSMKFVQHNMIFETKAAVKEFNDGSARLIAELNADGKAAVAESVSGMREKVDRATADRARAMEENNAVKLSAMDAKAVEAISKDIARLNARKSPGDAEQAIAEQKLVDIIKTNSEIRTAVDRCDKIYKELVNLRNYYPAESEAILNKIRELIEAKAPIVDAMDKHIELFGAFASGAEEVLRAQSHLESLKLQLTSAGRASLSDARIKQLENEILLRQQILDAKMKALSSEGNKYLADKYGKEFVDNILGSASISPKFMYGVSDKVMTPAEYESALDELFRSGVRLAPEENYNQFVNDVKNAVVEPAVLEQEASRLVGAEKSADEFERVEAANNLGAWGDPAAASYLRQALEDSSANVKEAAIKALGDVGSTTDIERIRTYTSDSNADIARAAAAALRMLQHPTPVYIKNPIASAPESAGTLTLGEKINGALGRDAEWVRGNVVAEQLELVLGDSLGRGGIGSVSVLSGGLEAREVANAKVANDIYGEWCAQNPLGTYYLEDAFSRARAMSDVQINSVLSRYGENIDSIGQKIANGDYAIKTYGPLTSDNNDFNVNAWRNSLRVGSVQDPNMAIVVMGGMDGQTYFAVMERVRGESIEHLLAVDSAGGTNNYLGNPKFAFDAAIKVYSDIFKRTGITFSDIKPENSMVESATGNVKIVDLDSAQTDRITPESGDVNPGSMIYDSGTAGFQPPELAAGLPSNPKSSVFSAGASFLNIMDSQTWSARTDFAALNGQAALNDVMNRLSGKAPQQLLDLVRSMLNQNAAQRPSWDDIQKQIPAIETALQNW